MSDISYIQDLYTKTHTLIHQSNIKPGTKLYRHKIQPNIAALYTIATEITDIKLRQSIMKSIENIHNIDAEPTIVCKSNVEQAQVCETNKHFLEDQMLSFSKMLKRNVNSFRDNLECDKNVLESATKNMQINCESADASVKKMCERGNEARVGRMLWYAIIIFILMYFVIRFM